jgi:Protein of unknown function (DUF2442)
MAEITKAEFDAANERGRILRETVPHAVAARYDVETGHIIVDLTNGATFAFPPHLVERLVGASPEQLAQVEVMGGGYGLGWDDLDEHITVPGLLNGIFGTAKWMAHLAGKSSSEAKASAARANGAKGGRPKKAA